MVVEVDNPDDAVRLALTYSASKQSAMFMAGVMISPVSPSRQASRPSFPRSSPKNPARVVFKNGHYATFKALYAAGDEGLTTEEMVKRLGANGPKSLPPTTAAWGKRAKSVGLDFRALFDAERGYAHGKPQTIYRLTAKGREVFGPPEAEQAQAVGGLGL